MDDFDNLMEITSTPTPSASAEVDGEGSQVTSDDNIITSTPNPKDCAEISTSEDSQMTSFGGEFTRSLS